MKKLFLMFFFFLSVLSFSEETPEFSSNKYYQYILKNTGNEHFTKEIFNYINYFSEKYDVEIPLILAIIKVESNFDPLANSKAGAIGIMQLMPDTAQELNVNPYILEQNLDGGIRYLSNCIKKSEDIGIALIVYNSGFGNFQKYDSLPPFLETQKYIEEVIKIYNELSLKKYIYNSVSLTNSSDIEFKSSF